MRKIMIIFLIVSLVIFTSCNGTRNRDGEDIADEEYRRGDEGLRLEFVNGAPPDKIYSGNEMDIIVEIRNMGAYPSTDSFDGKIEIYGFDEKAFSGEHWDGSQFISPDLQGRSPRSPRGGREVKQYNIDEVNTLFGSEFYRPTIIAAACYKYRTLADASVCVDPNPYSIFDEEKVCTISNGEETYSLGTQGAPVAVTRIKEEIASQGIHFSIYIKNVGKGKVVDEKAITECPLDLDYNDVDKVIVRSKLPWDSSPDCQPNGDYSDPVRLDENGNGFIFCTFDKPASKSAIETTLQVQLDYRYMDWEQKKVNIINLDR